MREMPAWQDKGGGKQLQGGARGPRRWAGPRPCREQGSHRSKRPWMLPSRRHKAQEPRWRVSGTTQAAAGGRSPQRLQTAPPSSVQAFPSDLPVASCTFIFMS